MTAPKLSLKIVTHKDVAVDWSLCDMQIHRLTGIPYFVIREQRRKLKIPIGKKGKRSGRPTLSSSVRQRITKAEFWRPSRELAEKYGCTRQHIDKLKRRDRE